MFSDTNLKLEYCERYFGECAIHVIIKNVIILYNITIK